MSCQSELEKIRNLIAGAAASVGAAIVAGGIALALNAGIFTAPGASIVIGIAAAILAGAAAALGTADLMLNNWKNGGCASRECEGAAYELMGYVASAAAGLVVAAHSAAVLIGIAWIPFAGGAGIATLLVGLGIALGFLAAAGLRWDNLTSCQDRVAKSRGPLMAGENPSDPWFLRVKPKSSSSYEKPSDATLADRQVSSPKELRCQMFDVREWEIGAIAYIQGSQLPSIAFEWKFDGSAVIGASVDTSTTSTLTVTKPAVGATKKLSVTATDTNGFSSTRTVDVNLGTISIHCDHVLYFVPLEIPTEAPGPIEITSPKVNQLILEINDLATRDFVR